jgi:hypothetical protein
MKKILLVVALIGFMISGVTSPVLAKQGFYAGLEIPYNTIGGDFDIDSALGYGALLGIGFTPALSLELSYLASKHNAKWLGVSRDVKYSVISVDGKYSFRMSQPTQPYILFGLGIHNLVIDLPSVKPKVTAAIDCNNAIVICGPSTTSPGGNGDLTGLGLGVNLGVGVDHYFNPHFSAGTGLTYRIVNYNNWTSSPITEEKPGGLNGNGYSLSLNTTYHF